MRCLPPSNATTACVFRRSAPEIGSRNQLPNQARIECAGVLQTEFLDGTQGKFVRLQDTGLRLDVDVRIQGIGGVTSPTP